MAAVELPSKLRKRGQPQIPVTELVAQNRYNEALNVYPSLKKIKDKRDWYSLAFALDKLGYVDTAEILMRRIFSRFPSKTTAEDKLLYADLLRKKGNYLKSDSILQEIKNGELSGVFVHNQYADPEFLNARLNNNFLDVNLEHFRSRENHDIYGIVKSPVGGTIYYHERQPFASGLMNNIVQSDGKPFGRIKILENLTDTVISAGTLLPKQLWNRHLELSDVDNYGNQFVTVNIPLVNDQDKFLLNARVMKYDTALSKVVFSEIGFDRLSHNTSGVTVNPSNTSCVFSSDAMGSLGMADLHVGTLNYSENGSVTVVDYYNLGETVNTIKGEYDATFITDNIILFVSDGHIGFGGKDLYAFHLGSNKLFNLGEAINSRFDEITPRFIDGYVYFSSNRIGNRFDLFRFELNPENLENLLNPLPVDENNDIVNEDSELPKYTSVETVKKIESFKQIRKRLKDEDPRKYNYTRGVDFLLAEDSVRASLIDEIDSSSDYQDYKFMTLFHPSNDIVIEAEFERELQLLARLLKKRTDWAIVIRSHTDSKGSDRSNKKLSEERAGFLGDYLKYLNVKEEQVIIEGLGEAFPLNHCLDGAPCTEEELAKNRRTELILIKRS